MVTSNREIVNKNLLVTSLAMSCPKDINMGPFRGRSNNSSANSSRELFVISKASTDIYATHIEIQSENTNWTNQADIEIFHIPVSSQAEGESNNQVLANLDSNSPTICTDLAAISFPNQNINSLSLPLLSYKELQPANNNSWNGWTQPISLFRRLGTQDIDIMNIKISLERISDFVTNWHIKNNKEGYIPCLERFSKVVFKLVLFIFKGGWDNL